MENAESEARAEWRRSWPLVLACTLGLAVSIVHTVSLGLMIRPLQAEFGWSVTEITSGLTIMSILSVIAAPFVGNLLDKVGARRLCLPSLALYCIVLALLSCASSHIWTWWALWSLLAIVSLGAKPQLWAAAIVDVFHHGRGLAIALALCGSGLAQMALPFVTNLLIDRSGWRMAYVALGLGGAVVSLPLLYLFLHDVRGTDKQGALKMDRSTLPGLGLREGFLSRPFFMLLFAALLASAVEQPLAVHFVPILTSEGISRGNAAALAGLVGASSMLGRIASGYLLDRLNARVVGAVAFVAPAFAAILLLGFDGNATHAAMVAVLIAVLVGVSLGAGIDVLAYLTSRYLGVRHFGTFFGTIAGAMGIAQGLAPLAAARVFDVTGSFQIAQIAIIPAAILSAIMLILAGPYPDFTFRETR